MLSVDTHGMFFVCVCAFVCLWVHSQAVSFCTDHINDRTEAWAIDCSLKRDWRKKCEMKKSQTVKEYETAKKERGRELEDENLINIKKKMWVCKKTAWNRATTWVSTCRATPLPLAISSRTFFLLPFFSVSLGLRLLPPPPPHIITAVLALMLLMLLLIRTTQPSPSSAHPPPLQFCWVGPISPLPHGTKVIPPSSEWWWTVRSGVESRGRQKGAYG